MFLSDLWLALPPKPEHSYWVDRLDPFALRLHGDFGIRWYGLAYAAGIVLAGILFSRWIRRGALPIAEEDASILILYAAAGVLIGGRLGYCLLYNLSAVQHRPMEVLEVWHGGMASHGGIVGMILGILVFARQRRVSPWILLDATAVVGPIGIALGRIANFINGELWGRPAYVPWAVIFPRSALIDGRLVPRHPSQIYAAVLEGLLVFAVAAYIFRHQKIAGMTAASVCVAYGVARFIDEFWREPDLGQRLYWGWMTKGQLLTLPMLVLGLCLIWWRARCAAARNPTCNPNR